MFQELHRAIKNNLHPSTQESIDFYGRVVEWIRRNPTDEEYHMVVSTANSFLLKRTALQILSRDQYEHGMKMLQEAVRENPSNDKLQIDFIEQLLKYKQKT